MSGTVLVVEGETPLGRALGRRFRQAGWRVVTTFRKTDRAEGTDDGQDVVRAPWGKASPVSARNVMLKTLTAHQRLDLAVFPFSPTLKRVLLHEAEYAEIEGAIDEWVRGTLFLLREVLGQMVRQRAGTLALVETGARAPQAVYPPLEAMVRGALGDLTQSLVASYGGEGVSVCRFETTEANLDEYAAYIVRTLSEAPRARSYRFRLRAGLLERLGIRGKAGS